jgi:hypothetical protein
MVLRLCQSAQRRGRRLNGPTRLGEVIRGVHFVGGDARVRDAVDDSSEKCILTMSEGGISSGWRDSFYDQRFRACASVLHLSILSMSGVVILILSPFFKVRHTSFIMNIASLYSIGSIYMFL